MIKMKYLFRFINNLEKITKGIGFKLIIKRTNNDRALFRVNIGADVVANDDDMDFGDIWCYLVLVLVMIIELLWRRV